MKGKKGFTIIELVIVMAVIAILATVLIPTCKNVINERNESNDTMLVKNLNTALSSEKAMGIKHTTMDDAVETVKAAGYQVERINASADGNTILWDSKNDVFCYFYGDTQMVKYPSKSNIKVSHNNLAVNTIADNMVNKIDYFVVVTKEKHEREDNTKEYEGFSLYIYDENMQSNND